VFPLTAANRVDNFYVVAIDQAGVGVLAAGDDLFVNFDGDTTTAKAQLFN
jgi:hypothetical protein|tara:strand:- start:776 stop:925 length:150 start_codon:yes stop_codon:yes gene_type:complete